MQRRSLLKLGAVSAAVLMVSGGAIAWLQPGLANGRLTPTGRDVFEAAAPALLDASLPQDPTARNVAVAGLLARIDVLIGNLPPHTQSELSQLLSVMATAPGRLAVAGLGSSWRTATVSDIQQAMQCMRLSRMATRQQAYAAIHDISAGAYFSDPSTWTMLGYPGPLKL